MRNQKTHEVADTLTEEEAFPEFVLINMFMKARDKSAAVPSQQADFWNVIPLRNSSLVLMSRGFSIIGSFAYNYLF